jgi:hypothetical protein
MKRRFIKKIKPVLPPKFQLKPDYKEKVRLQSYLGKKGYTIPKAVINQQDMDAIKNDLTMKPFTIGGPKYGGAAVTSFPVYRENSSKMYLPRFYGENRYGKPTESQLSSGDETDIPFVKELRDYQNKIKSQTIKNNIKSY